MGLFTFLRDNIRKGSPAGREVPWSANKTGANAGPQPAGYLELETGGFYIMEDDTGWYQLEQP